MPIRSRLGRRSIAWPGVLLVLLAATPGLIDQATPRELEVVGRLRQATPFFASNHYP